MFNKNDYIMYKNDVCKIKEIKHNNINNKDYYVLVPIDDKSLIIDVPTENKMGFLRSIISKQDAINFIKCIKDIKPLEIINDKYIENTYKELINNSTHENLIKIIKTSYLRNKARTDNNKKISEKDHKYFEKAEKYLYNEFSVALGKSYEETKNYIIETIEG